MHILAIIFGLLLLVFGGGCTLIGLALVLGEPENFWRDFEMIMGIWLPFGLAPMVLGWFLFRYGVKRDREKTHARGAANLKDGGGET